jgi:hypothetical protein
VTAFDLSIASINVLSGQSEVEEVWIAGDHVGREPVVVAESGDVFGVEVIGLPADGGPLVQQMPDFVPQRVSASSFDSAQFGIDGAFERVFNRQNHDEMTPAQLCRKCLHNLYPVLGPLVLQHVVADSFSDLPVHGDQRGIDTAGRLLADRFNQLAEITAQRLA